MDEPELVQPLMQSSMFSGTISVHVRTCTGYVVAYGANYRPVSIIEQRVHALILLNYVAMRGRNRRSAGSSHVATIPALTKECLKEVSLRFRACMYSYKGGISGYNVE